MKSLHLKNSNHNKISSLFVIITPLYLAVFHMQNYEIVPIIEEYIEYKR